MQCKLKYSLKTQKFIFLPVIELMLDSLTTIKVEPHQCLLHQSILLTKGPTCIIFAKKFQEFAILKSGHFEKSAILNFFLLHSHENQSKFVW